MKLDEARTTLLDSVLHVQTNSYAVDKQDRAIQFALNIFCRETRCSQVSIPVTISQGNNAANVAGSVTSTQPFLPSAILRARIDCWPVDVVDYPTVMRKYQCATAYMGQPKLLAFDTTNGVGTVWPIPDADYSMTVVYWEPLVAWTAGTGSPTSVTLNVDERWVRDAIWLGAGTALVYGEQGNLWAQTGWKQFEQYMKQVKSQTTLNMGQWVRADPDRFYPPYLAQI